MGTDIQEQEPSGVSSDSCAALQRSRFPLGEKMTAEEYSKLRKVWEERVKNARNRCGTPTKDAYLAERKEGEADTNIQENVVVRMRRSSCYRFKGVSSECYNTSGKGRQVYREHDEDVKRREERIRRENEFENQMQRERADSQNSTTINGGSGYANFKELLKESRGLQAPGSSCLVSDYQSALGQNNQSFGEQDTILEPEKDEGIKGEEAVVPSGCIGETIEAQDENGLDKEALNNQNGVLNNSITPIPESASTRYVSFFLHSEFE